MREIKNYRGRYVVAVLLCVMAMLAFSACGSKNKGQTVSVEEDFASLLNDKIPAVEKDEVDAMTRYNSYFLDSETLDTEAFLKDLQDTIVPKYELFLDNVKKITVDTQEVRDLYDLYYNAMELQYGAILKVHDALKEGNSDYRDEAYDLLRQASEKYQEFQNEVKKFADRYDITLHTREEHE